MTEFRLVPRPLWRRIINAYRGYREIRMPRLEALRAAWFIASRCP